MALELISDASSRGRHTESLTQAQRLKVSGPGTLGDDLIRQKLEVNHDCELAVFIINLRIFVLRLYYVNCNLLYSTCRLRSGLIYVPAFPCSQSYSVRPCCGTACHDVVQGEVRRTQLVGTTLLRTCRLVYYEASGLPLRLTTLHSCSGSLTRLP